MKIILSLFVPCFVLIISCTKTADNPQDRPVDSLPPTPVPRPQYTVNDYDAVYYPGSPPFTPYPYHVTQYLYFPKDNQFIWSTTLRNARDTLYYADGLSDTASGHHKGCIALVSSMDLSEQGNYDHYIGSYFKFSFFNDTAVGNLQFMIPADGFSSIDSIPVRDNSYFVFKGGLKSFYKGMAKAEVKITPAKNFVMQGDSISYANPLFPAQGLIDSVEAAIMVTRFSNNGFRPALKITNTFDAHYTLNIYFSNGDRFALINGKFTNLFFQKGNL